MQISGTKTVLLVHNIYSLRLVIREVLFMKPLNPISREERRKRIQFAVGMAAIGGGKPTAFTQNLLDQYENGEVSTSYLKQAIIEKYARASHQDRP